VAAAAPEKWHIGGLVSEPNLASEIAVIVTGEPIERVRAHHGGFAELLRRAAGNTQQRFVALNARSELPELANFAGLIVTGSAASVTEGAPWMLATARRLSQVVQAGTPVFGICFGHQLLGQALGGRVDANPGGREIGTVRLERLAPDPLFDGLPEPLLANMTHVDSLVELPAGATVIARTERDPYAAVRFGEKCWGVQFHPEMDSDVMAAYVDGRSAAIGREGLDIGAIRAGIGEGAAGREVLRRFLAGVAAGSFER
jgi:GMP synthase (glutamine-hydrolysing)